MKKWEMGNSRYEHKVTRRGRNATDTRSQTRKEERERWRHLSRGVHSFFSCWDWDPPHKLTLPGHARSKPGPPTPTPHHTFLFLFLFCHVTLSFSLLFSAPFAAAPSPAQSALEYPNGARFFRAYSVTGLDFPIQPPARTPHPAHFCFRLSHFSGFLVSCFFVSLFLISVS